MTASFRHRRRLRRLPSGLRASSPASSPPSPRRWPAPRRATSYRRLLACDDNHRRRGRQPRRRPPGAAREAAAGPEPSRPSRARTHPAPGGSFLRFRGRRSVLGERSRGGGEGGCAGFRLAEPAAALVGRRARARARDRGQARTSGARPSTASCATAGTPGWRWLRGTSACRSGSAAPTRRSTIRRG